MIGVYLYKESPHEPTVDIFYPIENISSNTDGAMDEHTHHIIDYKKIYEHIPTTEECQIYTTTKENAVLWCYAHEVTLMHYKRVCSLAEYLEKIGKKLLIVQYGDYEYVFPFPKNTLVVRRSYKKSLATDHDIIEPTWSQQKTSKDSMPSTYDNMMIPTVSYLGYGNGSTIETLLLKLIRGIFNTQYGQRLYYLISIATQYKPLIGSIILPQVGIGKYIRGKMINAVLKPHVMLKKIIVVRKKPIVHHVSTDHKNDYQSALGESQYGLCSRGLGNFSIRFFELCAAGVVPVLIDTDTILPFENRIPYEKLIIKIPLDHLDQMQTLLSQHRTNHKQGFVQIQEELISTRNKYFTYYHGLIRIYEEIIERIQREKG